MGPNVIQRPLLIFRNTIHALLKSWEGHDKLTGIWYDGESRLIEWVPEVYDPAPLLVEADLEEAVRMVYPSQRMQIVETKDLPQGPSPPPCFAPSNDTHVFSFRDVAAGIPGAEFATLPYSEEGAGITMRGEGIAHHPLGLSGRAICGSGPLVLGNDWGRMERYAIQRYRRFGVPSVCLQESVIDFEGSARRMRWCDFPFVQGVPSMRSLDRGVMFLTGNPRYEGLSIRDPGDEKLVVVNCNFTYGVQEYYRSRWVEDVVDTARSLGLEYVIAQHPRDYGDLSKYNVLPSGAHRVHEVLGRGGCLVTRFSSLIHEALAIGRPVIYFNPHGESMAYDFEPDGRFLMVADSRETLRRQLASVRDISHEDIAAFAAAYGMRHHGSADGAASMRVRAALRVVGAASLPARSSWVEEMRLRAAFHVHRLRRSVRRRT
jgi:hypothetical protein